MERFRLRHTFWLDMKKPDEAALAETIEELKASRSFVRTIRDGISLITDLRAGRLDVLLALFPWVADRIEPVTFPAEIMTLASQFQHMMQLQSASEPTFIAGYRQITSPIPEVKVVYNEDEARQRSIANTLAALEDF